MTQKIVFGVPPIYADIVKAFPGAANPNVLFSWGDTIYARIDGIPDSLVAHEAVHGRRQGEDVVGWWARYMVDPSFRLEEEIPAHIAEYQWWRDNGNRKLRQEALGFISKRLSSPLYGSMIPRHKAETILRKNTHERQSNPPTA